MNKPLTLPLTTHRRCYRLRTDVATDYAPASLPTTHRRRYRLRTDVATDYAPTSLPTTHRRRRLPPLSPNYTVYYY
ncbi:hypothetical protein Barb4_01975 [Bacteroidales bacterium Barb4]|nr:hypothetical protein Barb4_01975 [Bacteroidales bacterium Barb4]